VTRRAAVLSVAFGLLAPASLVLALGLLLPARGQGQTLEEAVSELRQGQYEKALAALRELSGGQDAPAEARIAYARALMEVGRYEDAVRAVARTAGTAGSPELENVLGEGLYALGRVQEAEDAFRRALAASARDRHTARLNLGILLWNRGEREPALDLFDSFIDLYNRSSGSLTADELMAVGTAVRYLGVRNPTLHHDALMAFDDAAEVDRADPRPALLAGELFLEKYRATDARDSFREVLGRNPRDPRALLGQARILDFEGVGGAVELVGRALEVNPRYVEARAFLAVLHLKTEDHDRALEEALRALEVNPNHLEALTVLAACHFLAGDKVEFQEVLGRVRSLNPAYPDLYTATAELAVSQRLYEEAVELAGMAVALDSTSWRAWGVLGMNQLRTGAVDEGRRSLERAFAGDPFNPWYKNTLDLLDTFVRYERIETPHFEIFVHQREAGLLGPYAALFAEEAYAALRERYGQEPATPIRLEIYPSHADFSVRTLGMTGLGALGVSFGSTLVMDSPSARDPGGFNWASTLWHEVAHAFHLAMSNHRVPRWFTEGLAVHEQRVAREHWGHRPGPGWLRAYERGQLHPVSRLNEGFVRPEYPEQVVHSYYQASLVLELVEERWGLEGVLAMLRGYREGKPDDRVLREVLGQTPGELDETFRAFVRDRLGSRMDAVAPLRSDVGEEFFHGAADLDRLRALAGTNPGSFFVRLSLGRALAEAGRLHEAEAELEAALRLFPEYGGEDGPLLYLARIREERGDLRGAARALQQMGSLGETLHSVHVQEARLWSEAGDTEAAARALEKVVEVIPFDLEAHRKLADLYGVLGDHRGAVRERGAVLALDPPDRAEAHFRLALALVGAGDRTEARSQVLRALEIAPNFEEALELLLELRRESP
jgi:cellulose synthase operon protein C